uniref:Uncharacterized protein n=1 Tax=Vitis vinifera TaxID=29760 RepID=A5AHF0_VITVI|nr:hypothetical protein VITISV_039547 [Vitis vinifera]
MGYIDVWEHFGEGGHIDADWSSIFEDLYSPELGFMDICVTICFGHGFDSGGYSWLLPEDRWAVGPAGPTLGWYISEIEESSLESIANQWKVRNMKNRSFKVLRHKQIRNARRGSKQEPAMNTSWSSIYACYMSFRSSGSQQSNASNGVRFEVETKELQPLQADHSKLKEDFCTAAKSAFCYENLVLLLRKFRSHFAQCTSVLLKLPDICDRHFEIFCFRYLMSKSLNSPCNPPIIGFLSL